MRAHPPHARHAMGGLVMQDPLALREVHAAWAWGG